LEELTTCLEATENEVSVLRRRVEDLKTIAAEEAEPEKHATQRSTDSCFSIAQDFITAAEYPPTSSL